MAPPQRLPSSFNNSILENVVTLARAVKGRVRIAPVALGALVVGAMLALGISAPATATTPSTVSFTLKLTSKTGAALSNYDVYPIALQDGVPATVDAPVNNCPHSSYAFDSVPSTAACLHAGGTYTMTLDPSFTYTLFFAPSGSSANSGTVQYLGGTPILGNANTFDPSDTNTFLAASIATGATIVGTVTGPTGAVQPGAEVDEYEYDGTKWFSNNYTIANSVGKYSFTNVDPGSYKFEFYAPLAKYPPIFSGGATTLDAARATFVGVGVTATVNQKFSVGTGSIYGTYNAMDGGVLSLPLSTGAVGAAFPVTAEILGHAAAIDADKAVYGAPSNSHGQWTVGGLTPGDYVIQMQPGYFGESASYVSTTGGDKIGFADAKVFTVIAGAKTNAGTFSSTVSDPAPAGSDGASPVLTIDGPVDTEHVPGAEVQITQDSNPIGVVVTGTSDSSGIVKLFYGDGVTTVGPNYDPDHNVLPLAPSWYTITVIDPTGEHEPYSLPQYLDFGVDPLTINLPDTTLVPAITGTPVIDSTATAVGTIYQFGGVSANRAPEATLSYQWLRGTVGNFTPIYGATGTTYQSTGADLTHELRLRVTDSEFGFEPVYLTVDVASGAPVTQGDQPVSATQPTITPAAPDYLGTTLQAHAGNWTLDGTPATGLSFSYQWLRDGTPIVPAATKSTYVVTAADLNHVITVLVTAGKTGYQSSAPATSTAATPLTKPGIVSTKAPVVTTTVLNGVTTYHVNTGSWNTTGLTFTYVWQIGSNPAYSTASSITPSKLVPPLVLPGTLPLVVHVTAHKVGYTDVASPVAVAVKGTTSFVPEDNPIVTDLPSTPVDISSNVTFGDKLRVTTPGVWDSIDNGGATPAAVPTAMKYQWCRTNGTSCVPIAGATASTYTVGLGDLNTSSPLELGVVETPVSNLFTAVPRDPYIVGTVVPRPFSSTPVVTTSGVIAAGQTITAHVSGTWGTTGVTSGFQWYACPAVPPVGQASCNLVTNPVFNVLPGKTTSTLVLQQAYNAVYVVYRGTKPGYATNSVASSIVTDGDSTPGITDVVPLTALTAPGISGLSGGKAHIGSKLTVVAPKWNLTRYDLTYQWQVNPGSGWVAAHGALTTGPTYTPVATDSGPFASIRVQVFGTSQDTPDPVEVDSPAYVLLPGTTTTPIATTFSASATAFTVKLGTFSPAPAASQPTVTWLVNGEPFPDEPDSHVLVFPRASIPHPTDFVEAFVSYYPTGYTPYEREFIVQKGTTTVLPGEAIVESHYGKTLTLTNSSANPSVVFYDPMKTTYQWYSNGVAITGATAAHFTPSTGYIGRHLQVKATGTSPYYNTQSWVGNVTLLHGVFTVPAAPTITPTSGVMPGTVLTATPASQAANYGTTGITFKYQWQRSANGGANWSNIAGATSAHYTPVAGDATLELRVIVTATKSGYTSLSATSLTQNVLYSPDLVNFTTPALVPTGGVAKVGALLTVSVGTWNTTGLTYKYAWYDGDSSATGTLIPGVTGTTWTPTPTAYGDDVTVKVTASRAGYASVSVDSTPVTVGLGSAPVDVVAPVITKVGSAYTVSPGSWNLDGLSFTYDWFVGDNDSGVYDFGTTYTPASGASGPLTVKIKATRNGYAVKDIIVLRPTL
jgi:hypothetical protein